MTRANGWKLLTIIRKELHPRPHKSPRLDSDNICMYIHIYIHIIYIYIYIYIVYSI